MEERIAQLEQELANLKAQYFKDNFEARQIIRKEMQWVNKIGFFNKEPANQGAAVATVGVPSGTYSQAEANNAVTAINALIARLQAYGLLP